jgi:hypothetical protein
MEAARVWAIFIVMLGSWLGAMPSFILTLTLWNHIKK